MSEEVVERGDVGRGETECPRCGTFAPLHARLGEALCSECIARLRHDVERRPLTVGWLFVGVWQLAWQVAVPAVAVRVLVELPYAVWGAVDQGTPVRRFVYHNTIGVFAEAAIACIALAVVRTTKLPPLRDVLVAVVRGRVALVILSVIVGLTYSIWGFAWDSLGPRLGLVGYALAYGVWLSVLLTYPVVIVEGASAWAAWTRSRLLLRGRRLRTLVPLVALGVAHLALYIASVRLLPVGRDSLHLAGMSLVRWLVTGATLPDPGPTMASRVVAAVHGLAMHAATVPLDVLPVVVYVKALRASEGGDP